MQPTQPTTNTQAPLTFISAVSFPTRSCSSLCRSLSASSTNCRRRLSSSASSSSRFLSLSAASSRRRFSCSSCASLRCSCHEKTQIISHKPHTSHLTPHTSHLRTHTSHLTPHTPHSTPHSTHHLFSGKPFRFRFAQSLRLVRRRVHAQRCLVSTLRKAREKSRRSVHLPCPGRLWP
jgi:hypothetical protein